METSDVVLSLRDSIFWSQVSLPSGVTQIIVFTLAQTPTTITLCMIKFKLKLVLSEYLDT